MGQVLHGNATTTHANRKAIQEAPEEVSNNALAKHYGIHFETEKSGENGILSKTDLLV